MAFLLASPLDEQSTRSTKLNSALRTVTKYKREREREREREERDRERKRENHIALIRRELHWLPVEERTQHKLHKFLPVTYLSVHGYAPLLTSFIYAPFSPLKIIIKISP